MNFPIKAIVPVQIKNPNQGKPLLGNPASTDQRYWVPQDQEVWVHGFFGTRDEDGNSDIVALIEIEGGLLRSYSVYQVRLVNPTGGLSALSTPTLSPGTAAAQ